MARLRDRRHLRRRRGDHPAGRDLAAAAGDPDGGAVRSRDSRCGRAGPQPQPMTPAGFWRRSAAWTLDFVAIAAVVVAFAWRPLLAGLDRKSTRLNSSH